MTLTFVSHARTPEELKAEVVSDINRRINQLDDYDKLVSRSEAEKSRTARAKQELEAMLRFWQDLTIVRPVRNRK